MLFSALEPGLQDYLRRSSNARQYRDGQIIQHRGDAADGFWLIEEGAVTIGQFLETGEFRALALLGPGDSYGEQAVFSGRLRVVDAVSRGSSRVRLIEARTFLDALDTCPVSSRALLGALSAQLQDTLEQLVGLRHGTNPKRLAAILAPMSRQSAGAAGKAAEVAITQQELADLLGVTRATANTALRELEQRGLVERGYASVIVRDLERLVQFALA